MSFINEEYFIFNNQDYRLRYCVSMVSSVKLEDEEFLRLYFGSFSYLKRKFSFDSLVKCNFVYFDL